MPHRIYTLRARRPVSDLVQLWERRGELIGIAINLRFGQGFDVFAAPSVRGTDAEIQMLRTACATTARFMKPETDGGQFVLTDVFSADTVRIRLLEGLGFERFRNWTTSMIAT